MLDERAFAAAGMTEQRRILTGRDGEINIVESDLFKRSPGAVYVPDRLQTDIGHNERPLLMDFFFKPAYDCIGGVRVGERAERHIRPGSAQLVERFRRGGNVQTDRAHLLNV